MQPEAFRYDAVIRIAPQGNDELAGKRSIIGLRDPFAFSVRCLNHSTRALSGWNFTMRQASWIMILRTRALPERERPFSRRFEPLSSGEPVNPA